MQDEGTKVREAIAKTPVETRLVHQKDGKKVPVAKVYTSGSEGHFHLSGCEVILGV